MVSDNTQEKSYLCTTCESRLLSLQDAQTSLASHSFALPLHLEKEVNFWMEKPRVSEQIHVKTQQQMGPYYMIFIWIIRYQMT